jgi:predicted CXXCH cytochrome family protein
VPSRHQKRKLAEQQRRKRLINRLISRFFRFPLMLVFIVPVVLFAGSFGVAAQQEENNAFCASCHTQPESTYYQRSLTSAAVDMASNHQTTHSTKCIDCHSGNGLSGRLSAISMGAKNAFLFYTKTAIQPAPLTNPIDDGNCIKCHSSTLAETDFNHHFHAFLVRWQTVDPTASKCVDCHSAHTIDGDPTQAFLNTQRAEAVCQRCHSVLGGGG